MPEIMIGMDNAIRVFVVRWMRLINSSMFFSERRADMRGSATPVNA